MEVNSGTAVVSEVSQTLVERGSFQEILSQDASFVEDITTQD